MCAWLLRAPHLYESLRAFCLAAFAAERGAQVPFAFEEHATRDGPSLYEYRPLVRGFVEEQAPTLRRLPDARNAIDDLTPRAGGGDLRARARRARATTDDDALFRSILLPMLTWTAERCGGFDWHDEAFDAAYADLERTLFGTARTYVALAPLVGLSAGTDVELGGGITLRPVVAGEISQLWPEARGLMPPEFGRDVDRLLVLELAPRARRGRGRAARRRRRARRRGHARCGSRPPARSPPARSSSSGSTSGRCASRRCCRSPRRSRAARRRGSTRSARRLAADLRERLDARRRRPRARRGARPLGALALLRGAVPLGAGARGARLPARRRTAARGRPRCAPRCCSPRRRRSAASCSTRCAPSGSDRDARDAVRRALVETLLHGNRAELVEALDETLLGLRPRPAVRAARRVARAVPFVRLSHESRHRHVTVCPATVDAWTRRTRCCGACERIERLARAAPPAATLLDELRLLVREAEAWARARATRGRGRRCRNFGEEAEGMQ